jgi:hypothetical protein
VKARSRCRLSAVSSAARHAVKPPPSASAPHAKLDRVHGGTATDAQHAIRPTPRKSSRPICSDSDADDTKDAEAHGGASETQAQSPTARRRENAPPTVLDRPPRFDFDNVDLRQRSSRSRVKVEVRPGRRGSNTGRTRKLTTGLGKAGAKPSVRGPKVGSKPTASKDKHTSVKAPHTSNAPNVLAQASEASAMSSELRKGRGTRTHAQIGSNVDPSPLAKKHMAASCHAGILAERWDARPRHRPNRLLAH